MTRPVIVLRDDGSVSAPTGNRSPDAISTELDEASPKVAATMVAPLSQSYADSQKSAEPSVSTKKARMTGPKSLTGNVLQEKLSTPEK